MMRWLVVVLAVHLVLLAGLPTVFPRPQQEASDQEDEDEAEEDEGVEEDAALEFDYDEGLVGAGPEDTDFTLGLLPPDELDENDVGNFNFDDLVGASQGSSEPPKKFDAVKKGWVTGVKDQGKCQACVPFATVAAIEACVARLTGKQVDLSEQHVLDCSLGFDGSDGCKGSPFHANLDWVANKRPQLASQTDYPYRDKQPSTCKADVPASDTTVKVTESLHTYKGSEALLMRTVAEQGAAVAAIWFDQATLDALRQYKKGVFTKCSTSTRKYGHSVTVVGYGTAGGKDYWLIKNSWGSRWGEKGYIKLERGVGACDIGKAVAFVKCELTDSKGEKKKTKTRRKQGIKGKPAGVTHVCGSKTCEDERRDDPQEDEEDEYYEEDEEGAANEDEHSVEDDNAHGHVE